MAQAFQRLVPNTYGGHVVYFDDVDPVDPEVYLEQNRQCAR